MESNNIGELIKDWSQEDKGWLLTVPEKLQITAARHGRVIWQIAMQAGGVTHALGLINRRNAGNREIGKALMVLQKSFNDLLSKTLTAIGKTTEDIAKCQHDIELIAALNDTGEGEGIVGNRIIVPTRH